MLGCAGVIGLGRGGGGFDGGGGGGMELGSGGGAYGMNVLGGGLNASVFTFFG